MSNISKKNQYLIYGLLAGGLLMIGLFFVFKNPAKEYQIVFNSNGGSTVETQTVKEGEKIVKPEDPTKEKSIFISWQYEGNDYDFTQKVTGNITLTAKWQEVEEVNKYDIVFVVDGEEKTLSLDSITEATFEELGFPQKDGYEIQWYLDGKEYDFTTPITEGLKLEGKYVKISEYTIKFNSDGGTSVTNQKLKANEKVKEPETITKEGFIFEGWYLGNDKYDFDTPVTKSITLVAKWSEDPDVKRYEVKFDSDGGSNVTTQRVIENKTATAPKNPTKTGYVFVEWQLDNKKYDFKTKVTKDITLKAIWKEDIKYTVTFDSNGGASITNQVLKPGEKAKKPTDPKKDGYKFIEWLENNKTYNFDNVVSQNITLVARYEKIVVTPTPIPTATPTPAPTATPVPDKYTITATNADNMASPDRYLKVYKNGQQISFSEIKYNDGGHLCGSNGVVSNSDIVGESTFIVVLTNGTSVKATLS